MEPRVIKEVLTEYIKKYRAVFLILLAGILLMTLPEKKVEEPLPEERIQEDKTDLQESLSEILSLIQGAGKVEVLLTLEKGEQTVYQTDENRSSDSIKTDTILISNSTRAESGLIRQINPPSYRGAIILCQGADNAQVRLNIVEAVCSVTGLTSDRITVLKMK